MTIETKYNIGDEVWFMFLNEPFKSKVYAYIGGKEKLYRCKLFLQSCARREDKLFPTKEELLKSL